MTLFSLLKALGLGTKLGSFLLRRGRRDSAGRAAALFLRDALSYLRRARGSGRLPIFTPWERLFLRSVTEKAMWADTRAEIHFHNLAHLREQPRPSPVNHLLVLVLWRFLRVHSGDAILAHVHRNQGLDEYYTYTRLKTDTRDFESHFDPNLL